MATAENDEEILAGANKSGGVKFGFDPGSGFFALIMNESGAPGLVKGDKNKGFHLEIEPGDVWQIVFTLDQQRQWEFDEPAITFKNPDDQKFYDIIINQPQRVVMKAESTLSSKPPEPWPEVIHPFNLHLVVKQSMGHSFKLTIDPEVRNPPRGGN